MLVDTSVLPLPKETGRFHPLQLARVDFTRLPKHIAIIPDGNRRWAKNRWSSILEGYQEGADTLMEAVKGAKELGIEMVTFYSFSTENWSRTPDEVMGVMLLIANYLTEQRTAMVESGIRVETIGDLAALPGFLCKAVEESKNATRDCESITLILALNYGSRNEICRAFHSMLDDYENNKLSRQDINEKTISCYLDTREWGDPDLLIRTAGELRISNFLLWQISYAEIHTAPVLWPDFTPQHLIEAIVDYQGRQRRWGGG